RGAMTERSGGMPRQARARRRGVVGTSAPEDRDDVFGVALGGEVDPRRRDERAVADVVRLAAHVLLVFVRYTPLLDAAHRAVAERFASEACGTERGHDRGPLCFVDRGDVGREPLLAGLAPRAAQGRGAAAD